MTQIKNKPTYTRGFSILISSRSGAMLEQLEPIIRANNEQMSLATRCVTNGHIDPLYNIEELPDLLILHLSEKWEGELSELASRNSQQRLPVLVIGDIKNHEMIRMAMKAGARDFLTEPVNPSELIAMIRQIESEKAQTEFTSKGNLTAVINAKGGSGASMIACNLAHMMQVISHEQTILLDMDMQFGSLAQYLNMHPENGVAEALKVVDELDITALNAYLLNHKSGLRIMGATTNSIRLPNQTPEKHIHQLLDLLLKNCNQLVIDLPRMIDRTAIAVLQNASQIVLVVQQDFINIKDASHMVELLRNELGILDEQIVIAINRYDKSAQISTDDIIESLNAKHMAIISNDYRHALESLNKGEPIYSVARRSPLSRSLEVLQKDLINGFPEQPKGLINNLFSRLTGG